MTLHTVTAQKAGGPLVVHVEAAKEAQSTTGRAQPIAGAVFRYASNEVDSDVVGEFRSQIPDVPLGVPAVNADRVFLICGAVIHVDDPTPTAYVVLVSVKQDGMTLYTGVPEENGQGTIQDKSQPFAHLLKLVMV